MSQNTQYSLNRIYMILLGNTSRVHDPWGNREVHIPTRTISTCPSYTQSHVNVCIEYYFKIRGWWCISLNQYRHNTQPPQLSQLYRCKKNKTQSHKNFKSIIYHLMPICFGILNLQSTSIVEIFLFITPVLVPMPVTPLIRDHHIFPLPLCLFLFLIFN